MNKSFKKLLRFWYIYLISIVVAVTGTVYWCNFINRPKNEATISLFVATFQNNSTKLDDFLKNKSPEYLREINITTVNPKTTDYDYFMVNKGLNVADIFILGESKIYKELAENQFAPLKKEYLNTYFNYETEQYSRGILIHKAGEKDNDLFKFKDEKDEDENYYLFYRINSLHIGELNNSIYDTAIRFTKELLNYE